ncbi:hypothetical protein RUND412_010158 [Rhizina undulata]
MVLNARTLLRPSTHGEVTSRTFLSTEVSPFPTTTSSSISKLHPKPPNASDSSSRRLEKGALKTVGTPKKHVNPTWGRFSGNSWFTVLCCFLIMAICPVLVPVFHIAMTRYSGSLPETFAAIYSQGAISFFSAHLPRPTKEAAGGYVAWLAFQTILYLWLPGKTGYGQRTPAGNLLPYKVNGLLAWVVSHAVAVVAVWRGWIMADVVARNWEGLIVCANVYGFLLTGFAYLKALWWPSHAGDRKFSGSRIYDFYMGIELNPRITDRFDFKLFHNGRPGIVAWTLIDLSFAAHQYSLHGHVTNSILIVIYLHALYVIDFFINEDWYLRTIDICHDHYGFYLAWGSMVWLPGTYTIQAQYLARYPVDLEPMVAVAIAAMGTAGYILFRSVNAQKDVVRRTGGDCMIWGRKAEVLKVGYVTVDGVERESILLLSGWWGMIRHANYLGDLILSYSVCAACGLNGGIIQWWYAAFMTVLLVQRCLRDDARCRGKYGKGWEEYCRRVRWKLVPGIW